MVARLIMWLLILLPSVSAKFLHYKEFDLSVEGSGSFLLGCPKSNFSHFETWYRAPSTKTMNILEPSVGSIHSQITAVIALDGAAFLANRFLDVCVDAGLLMTLPYSSTVGVFVRQPLTRRKAAPALCLALQGKCKEWYWQCGLDHACHILPEACEQYFGLSRQIRPISYFQADYFFNSEESGGICGLLNEFCVKYGVPLLKVNNFRIQSRGSHPHYSKKALKDDLSRQEVSATLFFNVLDWFAIGLHCNLNRLWYARSVHVAATFDRLKFLCSVKFCSIPRERRFSQAYPLFDRSFPNLSWKRQCINFNAAIRRARKLKDTLLEEYIKKHIMYNLVYALADENGQPQSFLFMGPAGCGKTETANGAVLAADELGVRVIILDAADFRDINSPRCAEVIRELFAWLAQQGPCLVFLNEGEFLFSPTRQTGKEAAQQMSRAAFLDGMDELKAHKVVFLMTSNFDTDDEAVRRRFCVVQFKEPTYERLEQIFETKLNELQRATGASNKMSRQELSAVFKDLHAMGTKSSNKLKTGADLQKIKEVTHNALNQETCKEITANLILEAATRHYRSVGEKIGDLARDKYGWPDIRAGTTFSAPSKKESKGRQKKGRGMVKIPIPKKPSETETETEVPASV